MKRFRRVERIAYWVEFTVGVTAENIDEAREKLDDLHSADAPDYVLEERISDNLPGFDSEIRIEELITEWRVV